MSELYTAVKSAFEEVGWAFRPVDGREVIEADFEAYHTKVSLHVQVFSEMHALAVVSESPISRSEPTLLHALAELLMRTNTQLNLGAFEMDWNAPTYLFRASNLFVPGSYDRNIIAGLTHIVVTEISTRFLVPGVESDELVVETWVDEVKRASATFGQRILRDDEVLATQRVVGACTSTDGRPTRFPPELLAGLEGHLAP